jgi:hypothetical protein
MTGEEYEILVRDVMALCMHYDGRRSSFRSLASFGMEEYGVYNF